MVLLLLLLLIFVYVVFNNVILDASFVIFVVNDVLVAFITGLNILQSIDLYNMFTFDNFLVQFQQTEQIFFPYNNIFLVYYQET